MMGPRTTFAFGVVSGLITAVVCYFTYQRFATRLTEPVTELRSRDSGSRESNLTQASSGYLRLREFLNDDIVEILQSNKLPYGALQKFRNRIENGRITRDEITTFLKALSRRWPEETLAFVEAIDGKVSDSLGLMGIALAKIAEVRPELALGVLARSSPPKLNNQEIHSLGLACFMSGHYTAALFENLPKELQYKLKSAETESVLRREGLEAMIDSVNSLPGSAVKEYDEKGKLISVSSGLTSVALGEMGRLMGETAGMSADDLANRMKSSTWWGEPTETYAALKQLGKIDAVKAFEVAGTLERSVGGSEALDGAFMAASEFHPQVALDYLAKVTDINRQNSLLNILSQKASDAEIRNECIEILSQRGLKQ